MAKSRKARGNARGKRLAAKNSNANLKQDTTATSIASRVPSLPVVGPSSYRIVSHSLDHPVEVFDTSGPLLRRNSSRLLSTDSPGTNYAAKILASVRTTAHEVHELIEAKKSKHTRRTSSPDVDSLHQSPSRLFEGPSSTGHDTSKEMTDANASDDKHDLSKSPLQIPFPDSDRVATAPLPPTLETEHDGTGQEEAAGYFNEILAFQDEPEDAVYTSKRGSGSSPPRRPPPMPRRTLVSYPGRAIGLLGPSIMFGLFEDVDAKIRCKVEDVREKKNICEEAGDMEEEKGHQVRGDAGEADDRKEKEMVKVGDDTERNVCRVEGSYAHGAIRRPVVKRRAAVSYPGRAAELLGRSIMFRLFESPAE